MSTTGTPNRADAEQLAATYQSSRYREIDRLERYVDGSIYDGRPDFFNPGTDTPLLERKPCIVYPAVEIAIGSHADLVLGEGRWPLIKVRRTKAISEDTAKNLETLIGQIVEGAELRSSMREGLEAAMGERSTAFLCCVRDGELDVEVIESKTCTVTLDRNGKVAKLVVEYPFVEERRIPGIGVRFFAMLYRREIDAQKDTVFQPWELRTEADTPTWTPDPEKSVEHNLGFCPVVWYAYLPKKRTVATVDGRAIHEKLTDEIDAMNIGLSQRTRAAHFAGDPQMWEAGVEEDENPAPSGVFTAAPVILDENGRPYIARRAGMGRKKGAGTVWRYRSIDAKVGMLTLPGDALTAVDNHCKDLVGKVERALRYVRIDTDKAKQGTDVSGRALELLYKPQVDYGNRIREDFGEHGLQAVLSMLLRVAMRAEANAAGSVYIDGLAELVGTLAGFEREVVNRAKRWMPPALDLAWGPMFADTTADIAQKVTAAKDAQTGKLISSKTAVQAVAPLFGVSDIEAEIQAIEDEEPEETEQPPPMNPNQGKEPGEENESPPSGENGEGEPAS